MVSFSDEKKRLAMKLRQAMTQAPPWAQYSTRRDRPRKAQSQSTFTRGGPGRRAQEPSGTERLEISVPTAAAALLLVGIGMWGQLSSLFLVDQSTAALMMQAGSDMETASIISQGVSLL